MKIKVKLKCIYFVISSSFNFLDRIKINYYKNQKFKLILSNIASFNFSDDGIKINY